MSHIPYGYIVKDGMAVIDEQVAESISRFFVEFLECKSMRAAAKKAGLDRPISTLGRILKNKAYLGTDFYPQIIDEDIFRKANDLRTYNAITQNRMKELIYKEPMNINIEFQIGTLEDRYEDPYKQAEYAYSQIKEVNDE